MNAGDLVQLPDGIEHGTPEGFAAGCPRDVTECPAYWEHGMACFYAHLRAESDVRYFRAKRRDPSPAAIAAFLGFTPAAPTDDAPKIAAPTVEAQIVAYAKQKEARDIEAALAKAHPVREPIPSACPECTAGKHSNCDGTSWCQFTDQPTTCSCTHTPENTPEPQEQTMPKTEPTSTPATKPTPPSGSGRTREELSQIRAWARENGWEVGTAGRIQRVIIDAYDAAHSSPSADERAAARFKELTKAETETISEKTETTAAETPDNTAAEEVGEYDYATASEAFDEVRGRIQEHVATADELTSALAAAQDMAITTARPEWAQVTVSDDVERARDLAVRIEAENAILLEQIASIGTALEIALRSWAAADDKLTAERSHAAAASTLRIAANRHLLTKIHTLTEQLGQAENEIEGLKFIRRVDTDIINHLTDDRDRARAELEQLRARRWWQVGGAR